MNYSGNYGQYKNPVGNIKFQAEWRSISGAAPFFY